MPSTYISTYNQYQPADQQSKCKIINLFQDDNYLINDTNTITAPAHKASKPSKELKTGVTLQHTAVDPIKDIADINAAKQYFLSKDERYKDSSLNIRNYAFFVLACNCARRTSDILSFTISDVTASDGTIRDYIIFREGKTKKVSGKVFLNNSVQEALTRYLATRNKDTLTPESMLFLSREGNNKSIDRSQAWLIMKNMGNAIGLTAKGVIVGTYTCRKSFGYHALKNNPNDSMYINTLMQAYKHSSPAMTLHYVGIQDEEMKKLYMSVEL